MTDHDDDENPDTNPSTSSRLAVVLTRLRQEAGLTMYQLANRSGVSRGQLSRMESGEARHPAPSTMQRLARALNVEPEEFYDAVWQDADQPLPSPALYFRSKYQLSNEQIAELEASVRRLTEQKEVPPTESDKR